MMWRAADSADSAAAGPRISALHARSSPAAMPPRRSARVAAVDEQRASAFPQLPQPIEERIFALIPVDQRLRCAEVSRGWRATVALPALWRRVSVSPASGVKQPVSLAMLLAAVARAGNALKVLDVSSTQLSASDICAVLRVARTVKELVAVVANERGAWCVPAVLLSLLSAASPRLRKLHAHMCCDATIAHIVMENLPPYALLRLQVLGVRNWPHEATTPSDSLASALANVSLQPRLADLRLQHADLRTPGAMDAVANAVCARQYLKTLYLVACKLSLAAMPALTRALSRGAITRLTIVDCDLAFLDAAGVAALGAAALGAALCASSTLQSLTLGQVREVPSPAAVTLLIALAAHRSLRQLHLLGKTSPDNAATGAALALLATDAPALEQLNVHAGRLGADGFGPLCDALPRSSRLRTLNIRSGGDGGALPPGFLRARFLSAARANLSLRHLVVDDSRFEDDDDLAVIHEVQQILAARH